MGFEVTRSFLIPSRLSRCLPRKSAWSQSLMECKFKLGSSHSTIFYVPVSGSADIFSLITLTSSRNDSPGISKEFVQFPQKHTSRILTVAQWSRTANVCVAQRGGRLGTKSLSNSCWPICSIMKLDPNSRNKNSVSRYYRSRSVRFCSSGRDPLESVLV